MQKTCEGVLGNILELKFKCNDLRKKVTIRQYFNQLARKLWEEKDCFSAKRPFGNSNWECDIYKCLIQNKIIPGKVDKDGYLEEVDEENADKLVLKLIDECFSKDATKATV